VVDESVSFMRLIFRPTVVKRKHRRSDCALAFLFLFIFKFVIGLQLFQ